MYILKNAIKNIGRNKGRNILMAVIIFAIIVTSVISIIINTTTSVVIQDYKNRFGSEVQITLDFEKLDRSTQINNLTPQQIYDFSKSDYLQKVEAFQEIPITFDKLHALDEEKDGMSYSFLEEEGSSNSKIEYVKVLGMLLASNQQNISEEFETGTRKIIQGKIYSNENECLVSEKFAKLNQLSVGDTVTVKSWYKDKPMAHTLKISGIYEDFTMKKGNEPEMYKVMPCAETNRYNEILVGMNTASQMEMAKDPYATITATFFLKEPSMLSAFQKEITGKGLPEYYKVTTDEESYNRIVGPVLGLSKITNTFLIVVLALGSIILVLLSALAIRERKYEVGVLRAMGMKKRKVALGLVCEMMVITALCLCVGLGAGTAVSQPVADALIQSQVTKNQVDNDQVMFGGIADGDSAGTYKSEGAVDTGLWNHTDEKPLSEIEIKITPEAIYQIILISVALAMISSLVGVLYITKYEPIKILSERN